MLIPGIVGEGVRQVQAWLNHLPSALPKLATDGSFGPMTLGRILEFQAANQVPVVNAVDKTTVQVIADQLRTAGVASILNGTPGGRKLASVQEWLNTIAPGEVPLAVDGINGPQTRARVTSFQKSAFLAPDGIVGPLTIRALIAWLTIAQFPVALSSVRVRNITASMLGHQPVGGTIVQAIAAKAIIDTSTFVAASTKPLGFVSASATTCRLAIFAVDGPSTSRVVILVLPPVATPSVVLYGVGHTFWQAKDFYDALGWEDPLSPALVQDVLKRHVIERYAPQVLASKKHVALLHIVRAHPGRLATSGVGSELGPFGSDGLFTFEATRQIRGLVGKAFDMAATEAFGYSGGVGDLNAFVTALDKVAAVNTIYNIDPNPNDQAAGPVSAKRRQFLSGTTGTGQPTAGFEWMPLARWTNEPSFATKAGLSDFKYLHIHCMAGYALHLGMATS